VSKQDTHFINVFSLLIGLLVVIAIALFALARFVEARTQGQEEWSERGYADQVAERIAPLSREAIAGQDNAALAIVAPKTASAQAGSALPEPTTGEQAFQQVCSTCHGPGIVGAPKAGDAAAWGPRIAKGKTVLYDHALHGFQTGTAVMPPKGGRPDLPDAVVRQAVDYMVGLVKH
jgi:cytochrome c5